LHEYEERLKKGPIGQDLKKVRNVAPLNGRFGPLAGLLIGGFDMWFQSIFRFSMLGTLKHGKTDAQSTEKAKDHTEISYPKPDGVLSFDRLTNVSFSMTNHEEAQPPHLRLRDNTIPIDVNLPKYSEPAQRYCPAGVYEIVEEDNENRFVVNFQNCVHCKTCDIKDPSENITWATPQGGDGPNYPNM
jgi:electron-transferring-flavoprotein dehydrogenase